MAGFRRSFARQFSRPSGPLGALVGRLLARGNAGFNTWLVDQVAAAVPAPGTVVELGFGPGVGLHALLAAYPRARVVGLDPSPAVQAQARRRNRAACTEGRLRLIRGDAGQVATLAPVDLVVAVHVLYFWPDPVATLAAVREALGPAGRFALGYQLRPNFPPLAQQNFPLEGFRLYDSDEQVVAVLAQAGLRGEPVRLFGDPERPGGRLLLAGPADPGTAGAGTTGTAGTAGAGA